MGCDIHLFVEKRENGVLVGGQWNQLEEEFFAPSRRQLMKRLRAKGQQVGHEGCFKVRLKG